MVKLIDSTWSDMVFKLKQNDAISIKYVPNASYTIGIVNVSI